MKKIIASLVLGLMIVSANISNVVALEMMPITKYDMELMVTDLRKSFYSETYKMCRKDVAVGDEKLIKASFGEQVKIVMSLNNEWKAKIEKTRALTAEELSDFDYIKKTLLLELNDPKRRPWTICDTIADDFKLKIEANTEGYLKTLSTLSNEYKSAVFTKVKNELSSFESTTMSGSVAVIKDKKLVLHIKDLNSYKAVVVERTNVSGKIIGHYVFLPHYDINNRNAELNGFKLSVLTPELMFRMYNGLANGKTNVITLKLPVKKIGSMYYGYKAFR